MGGDGTADALVFLLLFMLLPLLLLLRLLMAEPSLLIPTRQLSSEACLCAQACTRWVKAW